MCGRFVQNFAKPEVIQFTEGLNIDPDWMKLPLKPSFNIAPTHSILTLWKKNEQNQTVFKFNSWGYKGIKRVVGNPFKPIINIRLERINESRNWMEAISNNRKVLIPASGWFEWKRGIDGKNSKKQPKIPYYFYSEHQSLLFFAGISDKEGNVGILTQAANKELSFIHDRMPVILGTLELQVFWLFKSGNEVSLYEKQLHSMLEKDRTQSINTHIVSDRVNKVSNNDASLISPSSPPPVQTSLF